MKTARLHPSSAGLAWQLLRRGLCALLLSWLALAPTAALAQTGPLARYGRLRVDPGSKRLTSAGGTPVQLRGMSSHGLQWFGDAFTASSIASLAKDWKCSVVRAAMYVGEGGYAGRSAAEKTAFRSKIHAVVNAAEDNGVYAIIDWHVLNPGDPNAHLGEAREFFRIMSSKYAGRRNVIYEICNEPNGNVSWARIKQYAEVIIPIIRKNDPNGIILVGTPEWSSRPDLAAASPLIDSKGKRLRNVMYTFHFYSGTHYWQARVQGLLSRIPLFCTEWGASEASGTGNADYANATKWLNLMDANRISWCNWSFCDKPGETSAALRPGAIASRGWTSTTQSGSYVRGRIGKPGPVAKRRLVAEDEEASAPEAAAALAAPRFALYPNPTADGQVTVALPSETPAGTQLEILDAYGQRVYAITTRTASSELPLDVRALRKGTYLVRCTPPTGASWQTRLVKE
jgi:Cellulase (glycosyl hydrolase family 5)/Secretion system C-terminal sorting domain